MFKILDHRFEWTSRSGRQWSSMLGPMIRQCMMQTPHKNMTVSVEFKYAHSSGQLLSLVSDRMQWPCDNPLRGGQVQPRPRRRKLSIPSASLQAIPALEATQADTGSNEKRVQSIMLFEWSIKPSKTCLNLVLSVLWGKEVVACCGNKCAALGRPHLPPRHLASRSASV